MSFSTILRPSTTTESFLDAAHTGPQQISGAKAEKVKKFAKEFEANLLGSLYKDMRHSLGGEDADGDPGADTLADMGVHALATGIVAGGGIGIANLLIQKLIPQGGTKGVENSAK